ncbi:MAG TPA: alpha-glucosidase [Rubrobacter sp.]|nr:alpha-glucosidase [Rubrobacter sp.]
MIGRTWRFVGLGGLVAVVILAGVLSGAAVYLLAGSGPSPVFGSVVGVSRGVESGSYRVGEFSVAVDRDAGFALNVRHRSDPGRVLWSSVPGESFISAARGHETVEQSRAHFTIQDEVEDTRPDQTVDSVEREGESLVLKGRLLDSRLLDGGSGGVRYRLSFSPATDRRLRFEVGLEDPSYDRVYLTYASEPEERFFGFGVQYTHLDLKGREVPVFIQEQGIGRGEQPITWGADWQAGAGGDPYTSYASVPHYITSEMRSLLLENYEYSSFDLREDRVQIEVFSPQMRGQILSGDTPAELIEQYTEYSGRMRPLPDWILSGAVVGLQGGTDRVREIYGDLEALDTPISALWLQDWVGQRETSFGTQLWWNWELDEDRYPGWRYLVADLRRKDVRVMTYVSPFLTDPSEKKAGLRRNLFEEAERRGYLVEDRGGEPYMVEISDFSAAMVDLTNPEARDWMKGVIKDNLIGGGASGWMADFGEGLPYDAVLFSGADPKSYHNRYAEEWAEVNREVIREAGRENDIVFFNRSGYTRSPGESTLFWLGDQLVSWDEHDGIKSVVTGLLSSGLSGYSLEHSDIGGYTAIDHPLLEYHRSKELLMRWTELGAFTTVFRTHEGNRPEDNHQIYSDQETLEHFSRFARVYAAWKPYRGELVREAAETGLPVVRHPLIHYPNDPEVFGLEYQFMVGSELMVAPVLDPGERSVEVYLPAGRWVHLWSGRDYGSPGAGVKATVEAPVGEPAVFYRKGSSVGEDFRDELRREGLL